jgi:hypothetical protein
MGLGVIQSGWRYAAASVIGTSHLKSSAGVCQDAHCAKYVESEGAFIGVVSDGAGSASHSQIGSLLTCASVVRAISETSSSEWFGKGFAAGVLEKVRRELSDKADAMALETRDLACTMLVAIVTPGRFAFWQIGDGAICFREESSDSFRFAFWPEKGDYANVTYFVTDVRAQDHLEEDSYEIEVADLAIFSDGLERLALDFTAGEVHTAFFNGLFPYVRGLQKQGHSVELSSQISTFLSSDRVNKRTDDDKTLILASRIV